MRPAAPSGIGGGREDVRERIFDAMLALSDERGYEAIEVADVAARAGVTREEFDGLFASKEECALALFDSFMEDCIGAARAAYDAEARWPDSLRAAAYALAHWLEEHPREMRFGALEMLWVSELSQARRELAFREFARMADGGREVAPDPGSVPASSAEGVVGFVAETLAKQARGRDVSAHRFVPQMMYLAVLPYLGEEAAARELEIAPPRWATEGVEGGYRPGVPKREPRGGRGEPEQPPSRLPRGRHGLPRELVAENQRQRLISGIVEAVAEEGYGRATIADITGAARLSRRTFYEHFSNKEECFGAAYEEIFAYLLSAMAEAMEEQGKWAERVRAGLDALLGTLAGHPEMARFFLIAPPSAGDAIAERHHRAMRELVGALLDGAPSLEDGAGPSEAAEQALAGGISRLIVGKLNAGKAKQLPKLAPALVELTLRPFVGSEEAARVAAAAG